MNGSIITSFFSVSYLLTFLPSYLLTAKCIILMGGMAGVAAAIRCFPEKSESVRVAKEMGAEGCRGCGGDDAEVETVMTEVIALLGSDPHSLLHPNP